MEGHSEEGVLRGSLKVGHEQGLSEGRRGLGRGRHKRHFFAIVVVMLFI